MEHETLSKRLIQLYSVSKIPMDSAKLQLDARLHPKPSESLFQHGGSLNPCVP